MDQFMDDSPLKASFWWWWHCWLIKHPNQHLVSKELRAIGAHNLWQSTWAKSCLDLLDTRLTSWKEFSPLKKEQCVLLVFFFVFTRDIQIAFIETKNVNVLRIFVAASFRFISWWSTRSMIPETVLTGTLWSCVPVHFGAHSIPARHGALHPRSFFTELISIEIYHDISYLPSTRINPDQPGIWVL